MAIATTQSPTAYLTRLEALLIDVEQWSLAKGLTTRRYAKVLDEAAYARDCT